MNLIGIAWRNIWRNRRRSLLSMLAVAAACALLVFMMAFQKGSYAGMIDTSVGASTGHLQVQQVDYLADGALVDAVERPNEVLAAADAVPHVRAAAPRVTAGVLVSRGTHTFGALLTGVDPGREAAFSKIPGSIRQGRWLAGDDAQGAVVGSLLATNLGARVGDELVFLGQARDGSTAAGTLTVRGIFSIGFDEIDRALVVAPLPMVQATHDMGDAVTAVAVKLRADRDRPAAVAALRARLADRPELAVREWPEISPGVMQSIRMDWTSGLVLYAVLVLVVAFGVANTFLMATMERTHEYGVLLSLGMGPIALGAMSYLESVLLTIAGLAAGAAVGSGAGYWLQRHGWSFAGEGHVAGRYGVEPVIYAQLSWPVLGWACTIVFVLTVLMAVYPAVRAARLKPVEAMRKG